MRSFNFFSSIQSITWVSGFGFLVLWLGTQIFPPVGEQALIFSYWKQYLFFALSFGALILSLFLFQWETKVFWKKFQLFCSVFFFFFSLFFMLKKVYLGLIVLSLLQTFLFLKFYSEGASSGSNVRFGGEIKKNNGWFFFLNFCGWSVALRLFYDQNFDHFLKSRLGRVLIAFFFSWLLLSAMRKGRRILTPFFSRVQKLGLERFLKWIGVLLLIPPSLTLPRLSEQETFFHHWGVYVGPAEMIRQGGQILWDVPSQYGMLNILLIAALPFQSVYKSLYWLNAFGLWVTSVLLFYRGLSLFSGFRGIVLSYLLSFCSVFMVCGWLTGLVGMWICPSVGPFRFFWFFLLLFFVKQAEQASFRSLFSRPLLFRLGMSFLWILGVFWSIESALYCSVVFFLWLFFSQPDWKPSTLIKALGIPFICLFLTTAGLLVWYFSSFGHLPDLRCFFDHASGFASGFVTSGIPARGAIWIPLALSLGVAVLSVEMNKRSGRLLAGPIVALGGIWIATSYYIGRGHENNILNLTPIYLLVVFWILSWVLKPPSPLLKDAVLVQSIQIFLCPLLTIYLLASYGQSEISDFLRRVYSRQPPFSSLVPALDESARGLLEEAGLGFKGSWVMHDPNLPPRFLAQEEAQEMALPQAWVPLFPQALLPPILDDNRKALYFSRFVERARLSGALLAHQGLSPDDFYLRLIQKTHRLVAVSKKGTWQLMRFEYMPSLIK